MLNNNLNKGFQGWKGHALWCLRAFFLQFKIDLQGVFAGFWDCILDRIIVYSAVIVFNGYVLPLLGISSDFGILSALGAVASSTIFDAYSGSSTLISDINGDRVIGFELALPLPAWLIFVRIVLVKTLFFSATSIVIVPLAKLLLQDLMPLTHFIVWKFVLASLAVSWFASCAMLAFAGIAGSLDRMRTVWSRIIFPLWFFGGTNAPVSNILLLSPRLGKLLFINPLIYGTEAIRAAALGCQYHIVPFWMSLLMLGLFSGLFFWLGFRKLKKMLDFV